MKKPVTVKRGKSLLDFIRTKEFSIRNIRTKNKVDFGREWKSTEKFSKSKSEISVHEPLIENGSVHSNNHNDALILHKHSPDSVGDPMIQIPSSNKVLTSTDNINPAVGQPNGGLKKLKTKKKKKKEGKTVNYTLVTQDFSIIVSSVRYGETDRYFNNVFGHLGNESYF